MKRIILIAALIMAGTSVFAQNDKFELAKKAAQEKQEELLANMKLKLENPKEYHQLKAKLTIPKGNENQQFLYDESKIDSMLEKKTSHTLSEVFNKLTVRKEDKNIHCPTYFLYEGQITRAPYYKSDNDRIDSSIIIVPIYFQTHTVTKNSTSNVKYDVTLEWKIEVKESKDKDGGIKYTIKDNNTKLNSSKASPIEYLVSDKASMLEAAKKYIVEWYANLPQTLDERYAHMSVNSLKPILVDHEDIEAELPNTQNFTITSVPEIRISIDPYQYIDNKETLLYTNPAAYIILSPEFNICIDSTLKNVDTMSVKYNVKEIIKPMKKKKKEERHNKAEEAIDVLKNNLSNFVSSRSKEQKDKVVNLFINDEAEVEVSHLYKNGTVKKTTKSVKKYLSLLKGSVLNMDVVNFELMDPNWDSITYTVNQQYRSKTYNDDTIKQVYLDYDSSNGKYLISKITVISTHPVK